MHAWLALTDIDFIEPASCLISNRPGQIIVSIPHIAALMNFQSTLGNPQIQIIGLATHDRHHACPEHPQRSH